MWWVEDKQIGLMFLWNISIDGVKNERLSTPPVLLFLCSCALPKNYSIHSRAVLVVVWVVILTISASLLTKNIFNKSFLWCFVSPCGSVASAFCRDVPNNQLPANLTFSKRLYQQTKWLKFTMKEKLKYIF